MNLLFIGHEDDLNGASRSLLALIDELSKDENINIHVLTSYSSGEFIDELKKRNIKIVKENYYRWMIVKSKNPLKWFFKKQLYRVRNLETIIAAKRMVKYVKENNIDIIHTNTSVLNIGALISKYSGIPHVLHIREFGVEDFNMHLIFNEKKSMKFLKENCNKIIAISKSVKKKYEKWFSNDQIKLVYNGISEVYLNSSKKFEVHDDINLIMCGRIEKAKGQEEAIEAINILRKNGYNNIKLKIIGKGDVDTIKKLKVKYQLENYIDIAEYSNDLKSIRTDMDIELVCSKSEAFGRVTVEAMMSKLAVIGANTGGTVEIIKDRYNGLIYEKGNIDDLAKKIEFLIKNRKLIKVYAENGYEYSKKNFTSKINADKIKEIYSNIISERNKRI